MKDLKTVANEGSHSSISPGKRLSRAFLGFIAFLLFLGLAPLIIVPFLGYQDFNSENYSRSEEAVQSLSKLIEDYKTLGGSYPSQKQGLLALHRRLEQPTPAKWVQLVRDEEELIDPWGKLFFYRLPGIQNPQSFDVFTAGPDATPDTEDDIGNWSATTK